VIAELGIALLAAVSALFAVVFAVFARVYAEHTAALEAMFTLLLSEVLSETFA
jgi:hypothetical protein